MKLKIISCNVMKRELYYSISRTSNRVDVEFLYQGLHEFPKKLNKILGEVVAGVKEDEYDYLLVNYGLCGKGTAGIGHPGLPIVINRKQDCIPLLVGDYELYINSLKEKPATFWYSYGWIEGFPMPGGPDYVQKYSEFYNMKITEKQRETIERMLIGNYQRLTFVYWEELGEKIYRLGKEYTLKCLDYLNNHLGFNLEYGELKGKPDLLQKLVDGEWDDADFVIVPPGKRLGYDPLENQFTVE